MTRGVPSYRLLTILVAIVVIIDKHHIFCMLILPLWSYTIIISRHVMKIVDFVFSL